MELARKFSRIKSILHSRGLLDKAIEKMSQKFDPGEVEAYVKPR